MEKPSKESPIACAVGAFSTGQRERWQQLATRWRSNVQEIRELPDGYAFRIPPDTGTIVAAAEWMTLDRLCCPFFTFGLEIEPDGGPVWLRLTGDPRVKEFIREAMASDRRVSASSASDQR